MSIEDDIGEGQDGGIRVAEYVLGVLDASEHEEVAALIAADPALKAEARFWQVRLSSLDADFAEIPAPAGVYGKIEARLFGRQQGLWHSLALWRGLTAGALAVAVVAIGLGVMQPSMFAPAPAPEAVRLAATLEAEDSAVRFLALYDSASGTVRMVGLSGEEVPEHDYELWFIEGDEAPVSLGVVPVDARSEVALTPDMRETIHEGTVFAITLEPDGGAPQGMPTGPVVAAGAVSLI